MGSRRGDVTEAIVIAKLMELGHTPCRPMAVEPYDIILDTGVKALKIQIKTAYYRSGRVEIKLQSSQAVGSHYCGKVDYIIAYSPTTRTFHIVDPNIHTSGYLRVNPDEHLLAVEEVR